MADYAPVQETLAAPTGPPIDPDVLEQRRRLAQALIAQAMGGEPIGSWTQGVANLAQALMGGYTVRKANQQEAAGRASASADLAGIFGDYGGGTADVPGTEAVSAPPGADLENYLAGGARGKAGYVYQGMLKRGATPAGAAAFAASMQQESGFNPNAYNPGEGAISGIQWRGPRAAGLKAFASSQGKPWNTLDTNMDYAVHEMKTTEAAAGQAFFNAKTPEEANRALKQYIRYGDKAGPAGSAGWDYRKRLGNTQRILQQNAGGGETAALPNVDPVAFAPSPDVAAFIGGGGNQPQPAGLQIGDGSVPPVPQPRPNISGLTDPLNLPPSPVEPLPPPPSSPVSNIPIDPRLPQPRPDPFMRAPPPPLTTPLPPVQAVARAPQPRPQPPAPAPAPAAAAAAAAPATTASIPQPQPRRQIFREPYPSTLSAQEFARQGQNYLTGRPSFADQARVAPRTMQGGPPAGASIYGRAPGTAPVAAAPVYAGASGAAPAAAAPGQPRRGLLDALFGRGAPGGPAAAQAAPAGSPVAAGATAAGGIPSRISALLANPYVDPAVKTAILARMLPKDGEGFTLGPGEKRFAPGGGVIAEGGPEKREIRVDANQVPRYVDTGEPVFGSDTAGGKPPVKITDVTTMRKEIQDLPGIKAYKLAIPSQNSMAENFNKNTRASDLDFIYAMAKIFDPTSVVREAEQVAVKNSQGLPDQVVGYINAVNGGATLSSETRRALWETTGGRMKQYREAVDAELSPFPGIAERWGIDPRDIMPELVEMKDLPPIDKSTAPPIIHE